MATSEHHPESPTSWNTFKNGSDASVIAFAEEERSGCEAMTDSDSRVSIYNCPWWNDGARKDASGSTALGSCDHVSADAYMHAAVKEIAPNAAAGMLYPWSTTLAAETSARSATSTEPGAVGVISVAEATLGGNPWGLLLANTEGSVGQTMKAVMSSGHHEMSDSSHAADSDADNTTLYIEEHPNKPALKQHWLTATDVAVGLPGQAQLLAEGYRDSLLFYAFPLSEQREALPPQQHYLGNETYDQAGDDSVSKGAGSSPTLGSCYLLSTQTCVLATDENSFQRARH